MQIDLQKIFDRQKRTYQTSQVKWTNESNGLVAPSGEIVTKADFQNLTYWQIEDKLIRFDEPFYQEIWHLGIPYQDWHKLQQPLNHQSLLDFLEWYFDDLSADEISDKLKPLAIDRINQYFDKRFQIEKKFAEDNLQLDEDTANIKRMIADFEIEKSVHGQWITALPERAYLLAKAAHTGQVDKAGVDYMEHPKTVASFVTTDKEKAVAFLHDTFEDTKLTVDDLRKIDMPDDVIQAVSLLTHDKQQPYFDYLAEVKQNPLARIVKLADLKHNSDLSRLTNPTDEDYSRL
jgi:hypothetical protein